MIISGIYRFHFDFPYYYFYLPFFFRQDSPNTRVKLVSQLTCCSFIPFFLIFWLLAPWVNATPLLIKRLMLRMYINILNWKAKYISIQRIVLVTPTFDFIFKNLAFLNYCFWQWNLMKHVLISTLENKAVASWENNLTSRSYIITISEKKRKKSRKGGGFNDVIICDESWLSFSTIIKRRGGCNYAKVNGKQNRDFSLTKQDKGL